jgi:glycerol-3-phosphate dehydrogenase (NAD(P)+)
MDLFGKNQPVGVIGSGNFGTAVANLLARNSKVLLYTRRSEIKEEIENQRMNRGQEVHPRITPCDDLQEILEKCFLIFPVIPSKYFRETMKEMAPMVRPDHVLVHGTKGLAFKDPEYRSSECLGPEDIFTMSQVIRYETNAKRVGVISGPNLSGELSEGKPAATVVSSYFSEVCEQTRKVLSTDKFRVYLSDDPHAVELAGTLKNVVAIAAGALESMELGHNARSFLITRGLAEMTRLGEALGAKPTAFLGLAGLGDLIATCSSDQSRNFQVGYQLGKGSRLDDLQQSKRGVAEGVHTVQVMHEISTALEVKAPLVEALHTVLFSGASMEKVLKGLMERPPAHDVEFR